MRSAYQVTNFINENISIQAFYNFVTREDTYFDYEINAGGRCGWTALQAACHRTNLPLINALLVMGANPNLPRDNHYTALYDAIESGNIEAVKLLRQYGARLDSPHMDYLGQARKKNNIEIVDYLTNSLTDVERKVLGNPWQVGQSNAYEYDIRKKFQNSIINQNYQMAKKLLDENNIRLLDKMYNGLSYLPPLKIAALQGNLEMVQLLVEHGAFLIDEDGDRAHSLTAREAGHKDIAQFLENAQCARYQRLKTEAAKQKEIGRIAKAKYYRFNIFYNETRAQVDWINHQDNVNIPTPSTLIK